ncbi:hypothetical protein EI94DRAFT_1737344 [Lactarius quietus]|nr:hypothetical protein EI94DRAFT_1737344 [Lactarius quietus]
MATAQVLKLSHLVKDGARGVDDKINLAIEAMTIETEALVQRTATNMDEDRRIRIRAGHRTWLSPPDPPPIKISRVAFNIQERLHDSLSSLNGSTSRLRPCCGSTRNRGQERAFFARISLLSRKQMTHAQKNFVACAGPTATYPVIHPPATAAARLVFHRTLSAEPSSTPSPPAPPVDIIIISRLACTGLIVWLAASMSVLSNAAKCIVS